MKTISNSLPLLMAWLAPVLFAAVALGADRASGNDYLAYIGTYTQKNSKGIYVFRLNSSTGKLTPLGLAAETTSPSYLAIHPNHRFLYAVAEVNNFGGQKSGAVSAFSIDRSTGKLTLLNQVSARGSGPCHVMVDPTGKTLLVANYDSGSVAALPVGQDGRLREASAAIQHHGTSVNPERQEGPHAHCINNSPDNRFVLAADLGLDQVLVYRFDPARGSLAPNDPPFGKTPPGAGPRHFAFHPNGRFVYVINEIQCTASTFSYDAQRGALKLLATVSTVPKDYKVTKDDSTAEIRVHPSGKFVYGSNRGPDSIAVFSVDSTTGTLHPIEYVSTQGKTPRGFNIDPTGSYLIAGNQDSDSLVVFRIDQKTGRLTPTGQKLEAYAPVDVEFVAVK
ncbi:MAG TPA: lactonase family protein [Bryobacteraceae bacterium]|nr:lactonase family protein [Bryobacteraceae bacterium]